MKAIYYKRLASGQISDIIDQLYEAYKYTKTFRTVQLGNNIFEIQVDCFSEDDLLNLNQIFYKAGFVNNLEKLLGKWKQKQ